MTLKWVSKYDKTIYKMTQNEIKWYKITVQWLSKYDKTIYRMTQSDIKWHWNQIL